MQRETSQLFFVKGNHPQTEEWKASLDQKELKPGMGEENERTYRPCPDQNNSTVLAEFHPRAQKIANEQPPPKTEESLGRGQSTGGGIVLSKDRVSTFQGI